MAELRTNVSEQCQAAMIELHGQEMWDRAVAQQEARQRRQRGRRNGRTGPMPRWSRPSRGARQRAPIGNGVATVFVILALVLTFARGIVPTASPLPLMIGAVGIVCRCCAMCC